MKYLELEDIQREINAILLERKFKILKWEQLTTAQAVSQLYNYIRIIEYKFFIKERKVAGIILRSLYTLIEKLNQHEKKKILLTQKEREDDTYVRSTNFDINRVPEADKSVDSKEDDYGLEYRSEDEIVED